MNNKYVNFDDIKHLTLPEFARGGESKIYKLPNDNLLFKKYDDYFSKELLKSRANILDVITDITSLDDECIIPKKIVYEFSWHSKKLVGLIMNYFNGLPLNMLNNKNIIIALKKIKLIIYKLEQYNIRYFDFSSSNILYKDEPDNIRFIDMDNVSIKGMKNIYTGYRRIEHYLRIGGKDDFNAEIYLFNWLTYTLLTKSTSNFYESSLNYGSKLKENNLYTSEINKFCYSMFNNDADQIADHEFLIDRVNKIKRKIYN